ncbi:DUF397 domain-containing protein [Actinophytocola glycyrrhizae]|uniref:DUF397 domain-containing protein n=1 Tax=Actinophytocola glycyrrhizae TaxID=2044873 RepID=A0ABV9S5M7_9PSEU
MRDTGWFKSTFSGTANDNCVEVRLSDGAARVRDSKNPASALAVDVSALVAVVKAGRLDR